MMMNLVKNCDNDDYDDDHLYAKWVHDDVF